MPKRRRPAGNAKRRHLFEQLEARHLLAASPFGTNPLQPLDVTRDGQVTPLDALRVINALNRADSGVADPANSVGSFIDVSGDGEGTALDALRVINALNREVPLVAATLPNDSGPAERNDLAFDLLTNDYELDLRVSVGSLADRAVEIRIGAGNAFSDITNQFTDESAKLTASEIDAVFGQPLPDGDHNITVRIVDGDAINFVLTVDRAGPLPQPVVGDIVRVAPNQLDVNFGEAIAETELDTNSFGLRRVGGESVSINSTEASRSGIRLNLADRLEDADFELSFSATVTDLAGNISSAVTKAFTVADPTGISLVAPRDGERLVRTTRDIVVNFDEPIDPNTVNADAFYVNVAGTRYDGTIRVGSDNRSIRLTPDLALPSSATGRLIVDGGSIMGADGLPLDADADNEPGGVARVEFSTVGLTQLANTAVHGFIFDSTRSTEGNNVPIVGVTLRVEGLPNLTATTDENGFFRLENTPGDEFFVEFDMSTVTSSPNGFQYLAPAKPFHPIPGMDVPLGKADGKMFDIFFPLVELGEAIPVTAGEATMATFGEAALAHLQEIRPDVPRSEWEKLAVEIPADSLLMEDGTPADEVQIFALDPDRIPAPLPADVNPSIVFSIDAAGAKDFGTTAKLTFPNLDNLASGEVRPIWTFDHDGGEWKITGRAVVSEDGSVLVTDEGGVTTLGWKGIGNNPGEDGDLSDDDFDDIEHSSGDQSMDEEDECSLIDRLSSWLDAVQQSLSTAWDAIALVPRQLIKRVKIIFDGAKTAQAIKDAVDKLSELDGLRMDLESLQNASSKDIAQRIFDRMQSKKQEAIDIQTRYQNALADIDPLATKEILELRRQALVAQLAILDATNDPCFADDPRLQKTRQDIRDDIAIIDDAIQHLLDEIPRLAVIDRLVDSFCNLVDVQASAVFQELCDILDNQASRLTQSLLAARSDSSRNNFSAEGESLVDAKIEEFIAIVNDVEDEILALANAATIDPSVTESHDRTLASMQALTDVRVNDLKFFYHEYVVEKTDQIYYRISSNGLSTRGSFDFGEGFSAVLNPETTVEIEFYDTSNHFYWHVDEVDFTSPLRLIDQILLVDVSNFPDADADGVSDVGERVVGSSPNLRDTDGDGVLDGAELTQRLNPLDGIAFPIGINSSVQLEGSSADIVVAAEYPGSGLLHAFVATGFVGLAIVDVADPLSPRQIGQLDLDGFASSVAIDNRENIAFVAGGDAGLHIIDVHDPLAPKLVATISELGLITQVEIVDGLVAAVGRSIWLLDPISGEVLQEIELSTQNGRITDVAQSGGTLFAISGNSRLHSIAIDAGSNFELDNIDIPIPPVRRMQPEDMRLFVADGVAYVSNGIETDLVPVTRVKERGGYVTFDVSDPNNLSLISDIELDDLGNDRTGNLQTVLNGSGLALVAAGKSLGLQVHDARDPSDTYTPLSNFDTPGTAEAVAVVGGIAFVADGPAGLQVINYRDFDALGVAPTVTIESEAVDADPQANGIQVEEGTTIRINPRITDDVQVRTAELIIDGVVVETDLSYPYDFSVVAPNLASGTTSISVQVRATDTGGNVATSDSIQLEIIEDVTSPEIRRVTPDGASLLGTQSVTVSLNEPVDITGISLSTVEIIDVANTEISLQPVGFSFRNDDRSILFRFAEPFPEGEYRVRLQQSDITDRGGNLLASEILSQDFEIVEATAIWLNPAGGFWDDTSNWAGGVVPGPGDGVLMTLNEDARVTYRSSAPSISKLILNGGTVEVDSGVFAADVIDIRTGTIELAGGQLISNFLTGSPDESLLRVLESTTLDGLVTNVDVLVQESTLLITGGLVLNSDLTLNDTSTSLGRESILRFEGNQTLGGTGRVVFAGPSGLNAVEVRGDNGEADEVLIVADGITIGGGTGRIRGVNGAAFDFLGIINAEGDGVVTVTQRDLDGGVLRLDTQDGGTIVLSDGSILVDVAVEGTPGTTLSLGSVTFDNVTLNTDVEVNEDEVLTAKNNLTVNNSLTLDDRSTSLGRESVLRFDGSQTLHGTGRVVLSGTSKLNAIVVVGDNLDSPERLTVSDSVTIVGVDAELRSVSAAEFSGAIRFDGGGSAPINLTGGATYADATLNGQGESRLLISTSKLDDAVVNLPIILREDNVLTVENGLVLNSDLTLNDTSASLGRESILRFEGNQTLGGTGRVVFAGTSGLNAVEVRGNDAEADEVLVVADGITIGEGTGKIRGVNGATFDFLGTIAAEGGGAVTLTQRDLDGGVLRLDTQNGGAIVLSDGSLLVDVAVEGTLGTTLSLGSVTFDNVTLNTDVEINEDEVLTAKNNLTVNNSLTLDDTSSSLGRESVLRFDGTQTLGGTGQIVLSGESKLNAIVVVGDDLDSPERLMVADSVTIVGVDAELRSVSGAEFSGAIRFDGGGSAPINLTGGATYADATLNGQGESRLLISTSKLDDAVVNLPVILREDNVVTVENGLVLNSDLTLNDTSTSLGRESILRFEGNQTLGGTGRVVFAGPSGLNAVEVRGDNGEADEVLIVADGITIGGGTGRIRGVNGAAFDFLGIINAEGDGVVTVTQRDLDGGVFRLDTQDGGTIVLSDGSILVDVVVEGTSGTKLSLGSVTFDNVTLNTDVEVNEDEVLTAKNNLTVNNSLTLDDSSSSFGRESVLRFDGSQTLGGTGRIILTGESKLNAIMVVGDSLDAPERLTVADSVTIVGVDAELRSVSGAEFSGAIRFDGGGSAPINLTGGATYADATLNGRGDSRLLISTSKLDDAMVNIPMILREDNVLTVENGLVLNTELTLNDTSTSFGRESILRFEGNQTLGGTGRVVFAGTSGLNAVEVRGNDAEADEVLVVADGITIGEGTGKIRGVNGATFDFLGTVLANAGESVDLNNVNISLGTIVVVLASVEGDQFGRVTGSGPLVLPSVLRLVQGQPFVLNEGDVFDVLQFTNLEGSIGTLEGNVFDDLELTALIDNGLLSLLAESRN